MSGPGIIGRPSPTRLLPFLALTLSGLCWGMGFPLGKLALHEVGAAHMILLRFAVASLVALPFALRAEARALFRSPPVLLAGFLYGVAFLIQFEGLTQVTVSLAALLVGAMPALVAVAAWILREKVSRASWIGVVAATAGAALIAGKPEGAGTPYGIALSLLSLLVFLAWLMVLKRAPATKDPMAVPAVTVLVAVATILPIALFLHGAPPLALGPVAWAGIIGQGVFATFVATAAWAYGSSRVGSAAAGVFINIEPLIGAIVGITLFGDPAGVGLIGGGLLIIIGSVIVVLGERQAPATVSHGLGTD
ncbi:DMT family transporter [Sphingomonas sp. BIUV-7]|uniref:DMT family transporter n=1 Tax=Sphingomonas natans TaxID=3063330 RepID=A0ABT8Y6Z4_9SPHN|nr:DMT family transporter [Sphingomonas sp. BIUV-7]MDO6413504.1 DMT family transporter [Sphingomonas sp. BIUV-7]